MNSPISVLLVDGHRVPRRALESVLAQESDVRVVASVDSVGEAGEAARRLHPDVAVVDSDLVPGNAGLLEGWGPVDASLPVVVVGLEIHPALAARVRRQGGAGYLLKEALADELPALLRRIHDDPVTRVPHGAAAG